MNSNSESISANWIDISYPLDHDMIYWPADPLPPHIDWISDFAKGAEVSMVQLNINPHHGTHVDSPRHFYADRPSIDQVSFTTVMGKCRVIEIKSREGIRVDELEQHNIQPGERILFKTINSSFYQKDKFVEDFVFVNPDSARYLVEKKIALVGLDYLAIGSYRDRPELIEVHRILLGNNIWIMETINLTEVTAGDYELLALPLKIKNGDAAPARALLRPWKFSADYRA